MITLLAAWLCFKQLTPGSQPSVPAMVAGAKLAHAGKGFDRLLLDDRQVVGRWARNYVPHDAEDVIWLSPDLISRWLGYLKESENLTDAEVEARWIALTQNQGRSLWFVIRLAALDKQDPLELGMEEYAQTTDLNPLVIRAALTDLSGRRMALEIKSSSVLASIRCSDANELIGLPWYIYSDSFKPLLSAIPPQSPESDLGSNEARLLFVQVNVPASMVAAQEVEVRVISRRKSRIARFSMLRFAHTQIQSQNANRDVQRGLGEG